MTSSIAAIGYGRDKHQAKKLIELVKGFVGSTDDLRALGVGGSWARGNPRPDSDLDLIIIAQNPNTWRRRQQWVRELPFDRFGFSYNDHHTATSGLVWSAHIELEPDAELELTLAPKSWASLVPIDAGTRHVLTHAFKLGVDKDRRLVQGVDACNQAVLAD